MANKEANRFFNVTKEINGKSYTAQFSGLSTYYTIVDRSYLEDGSTTSALKLANNVLKYGIVEPPNLDVDQFDTLEDANEVVAFAKEVLQGHFRNEAN